MNNIEEIRKRQNKILAIGSYHPGYQAIIDFDFLSGQSAPSIQAIVSNSGRFEKFFWGNQEKLIPCFPDIKSARQAGIEADWLLNISSSRRALSSTKEFFQIYPDALGAHIFAEDIPEYHALDLYNDLQKQGKLIIGPAGVGMIVPGSLKLGVIGGVDWRQIDHNHLHIPGKVAVMAASGGMINEIITMVARHSAVSFAICFGGDRFPATRPVDAFLMAEADSQTEAIVYYGELGGYDEYAVSELIKSGKIRKPVIAYIAGSIGESFHEPVQFGHAKALANNQQETATAKRQSLADAGAIVAQSMQEFYTQIKKLEDQSRTVDNSKKIALSRHHSLFTSTISREQPDGYYYLDQSLSTWANQDMALLITTSLLGHAPKSTITTDFVRTVFMLSVDHGPQVSGALNTIITARAGKGLVDSLCAGLLTIGPRFGGAVSTAAREWFDGVLSGESAEMRVEKLAKQKKRIGGIGHKKYRIGLDDPRTIVLRQYVDKLSTARYFRYASEVEKITTAKKGNLILNVDGHIAALMLDILEEHESYDQTRLDQLINADFFNALFVLPRAIGFTAHYLDQKRLDEGLFRLPDDDVFLLED